MSKIKNMRKYVMVVVFAFVAMFLFSVRVNAASNTGTVTFTVEKFTIGQGYLIEPCQVTITEGEKVSEIIERVLKEKGYSYTAGPGSWGWYLDGIANADTRKVNVPSCITKIWSTPLTEVYDNDLSGTDYAAYAGWVFYVNNVAPDVAADSVAAHDGDVIRLRFSLQGGADLGRQSYSPCLDQANLDEITKKMAIFNANKALCVEKGYQAAYNEALQLITNMDNYAIEEDGSNKTAVEAKVKSVSDKLPTASNIQTWQAEKAAAEKAAAEKAAAEAIKKNTPAAPKWKSVKAKTGHKVVLTWKKVSNATGYEVYMSTKKASGYKKIATLKKAKKITYTKNKLKKNKKYYFKVRAYRTVGGVKYVSGFSAVKKVKAK